MKIDVTAALKRVQSHTNVRKTPVRSSSGQLDEEIYVSIDNIKHPGVQSFLRDLVESSEMSDLQHITDDASSEDSIWVEVNFKPMDSVDGSYGERGLNADSLTNIAALIKKHRSHYDNVNLIPSPGGTFTLVVQAH